MLFDVRHEPFLIHVIAAAEDGEHKDEVPDTPIECPVCMEQKLKAIELHCKHKYCMDCIKKWMRTGADTCPLCRGELTSAERNRVLGT